MEGQSDLPALSVLIIKAGRGRIMICKVKDCTNIVKGHGFCNKHLKKYRKYGDPTAGKTYGNSLAMGKIREYNSYKSMLERCLNSNSTGFERYGGRGVKVCDRWLGDNGFRNFYKDMGVRPKGFTLDRINNEGDYCPDNCRWATIKSQNRNRRTNVLINYNGKTQTLVEWSEELGLNYGMLVMRHYRYGWRGDKLFSKPKR